MYIVNGDLAIGRIFIVEILDLNRSEPEFIGCYILLGSMLSLPSIDICE